MNLIIIAACLACCHAAKLNRGYLPPESAKTAGGSGDILKTPFEGERLPAGSYVNDFQGVVIDADAAGTRATHSGLGNSRETYGSTDSKVGAAAFRETNYNANRQNGAKPDENKVNAATKPNQNFVGHPNILPNVAGVRQPVLQPGDNLIPVPEAERFHAARDRTSNIIAYQNDIGITDFNYAFQTDNGISAGEAGMALDGVRSQGGYSYTGDDGQVYTIQYTADEGGYRPQGSHIPTPPPIPPEILKALEQNAKDEAAGIVDDGSYDAKKYNTEHTKGNSPNDYNNDKHNTFEKRPVLNVISTINQNSQANKPNQDGDRSKNNGQNQFSNGFTVNDKQISNFTNIRNQYENSFDIITNNQFNNNGPISNFKEIGEVQSNNSKNQSQNVPLSEQNLQDESDVPDSLNGRPNSYQAPISAVQNQKPNQAAFLSQTQAQLRPSSYSSINGIIQQQQAINKPINGFVNTNFIQTRPVSYQSQTTGTVQQNFNKQGNIFQTQPQNSNANQSGQQIFSSGFTSTKFTNINGQRVTASNVPFNNKFVSQTYNNQANIFSKPTVTETKPGSYQTSNAGVIQNVNSNVGNVFSSPLQKRPTSYDVSITGNIQEKQPSANSGEVFSSTTEASTVSYDTITETIQYEQPKVIPGNVFFGPSNTQFRPSYNDASITGSFQKESIGNSGSVAVKPTQIRPSSYNAPINGTIQNQQQINILGNQFSKPTIQSTFLSNLKQESSTNNVSPQPSTYQVKPVNSQAQFNVGLNNVFPNAGISSNIQNQGELYEYPKPEQNLENVGNVQKQQQQQPIVSSKDNLNPSTTKPLNYNFQQQSFLNTNQYQSNVNGNKQDVTVSNHGSSQFLNQNQNLHANTQQFVQDRDTSFNGNPAKQANNNLANVFPNPTPARPNSYSSSITGVVNQQRPNNIFSNAPNFLNNISANEQVQENFNSGLSSLHLLNANPISKDSSSASTSFGNPAINSQISVFPNVKDGPPKSDDAITVGEIKNQQPFNILGNINEFQIRDNKNNQQNKNNFNIGVTSTQFPTNSQTTQENNNVQSSGFLNQSPLLLSINPNIENSNQPSQSSGSFSSSAFTFNAPSNSGNSDKSNVGSVAISSSQNHNDDFQSNYLHKTFSIRRQQLINQQAFSDFLNSKNVANAPILVSSSYKSQSPISQGSFEFTDVNNEAINKQQTPSLSIFPSSQLNEPNPTPSTFSAGSLDAKLSTPEPSRILSTPKEDRFESSQVSGGLTQASISPFPSLAPSTSNSKLGISNYQVSNLNQAVGSSLGVNSGESQKSLGFINRFVTDQSNIQNQGEIYEYPKPAEDLPAPQTQTFTKSDFKLLSTNNGQSIQVNNQPKQSSETPVLKPGDTETESSVGFGPKLLPSRPQIASSGCCFAQNESNEQNQSNENSSSVSSTDGQLLNSKEEFEGPKTPQSYDESGYHY